MDIKYYDTHSHINEKEYECEIENVIKTLNQEKTITNVIGCCLESSQKAIELTKKYNVLKACVGIHPNEVINHYEDKNVFYKLDKLISENLEHIVAIGEIGIDLYYDKNQYKIQLEFLNKQIELAKKYNLPLMFHIRNAFEEMKEVILKNKDYKKVVHCFSTNYDEAKFYIENNCMISVPGILTFKNAKELQEAVRQINIDYLLAETDSPYLTPMPYRGKINYPYYVKYVYDKIAELKNMSLDEVQKKINDNAFKFFNLK